MTNPFELRQIQALNVANEEKPTGGETPQERVRKRLKRPSAVPALTVAKCLAELDRFLVEFGADDLDEALDVSKSMVGTFIRRALIRAWRAAGLTQRFIARLLDCNLSTVKHAAKAVKMARPRATYAPRVPRKPRPPKVVKVDPPPVVVAVPQARKIREALKATRANVEALRRAS